MTSVGPIRKIPLPQQRVGVEIRNEERVVQTATGFAYLVRFMRNPPIQAGLDPAR
jgi:hypothetical protein